MTSTARQASTEPSTRFWADLHDAVGRAVVGAEEPLRLIALALLADGHVLVEDVPGTGKTLLARAVARALGLETARVQGTPDLLPVDITGSSIVEGSDSKRRISGTKDCILSIEFHPLYAAGEGEGGEEGSVGSPPLTPARLRGGAKLNP